MTSDVRIDKGIPQPTKYRRRDWAAIVGAMAIDDSFILDEPAARTTIYAQLRGTALQVVTRKTREGIRVWRVK